MEPNLLDSERAGPDCGSARQAVISLWDARVHRRPAALDSRPVPIDLGGGCISGEERERRGLDWSLGMGRAPGSRAEPSRIGRLGRIRCAGALMGAAAVLDLHRVAVRPRNGPLYLLLQDPPGDPSCQGFFSAYFFGAAPPNRRLKRTRSRAAEPGRWLSRVSMAPARRGPAGHRAPVPSVARSVPALAADVLVRHAQFIGARLAPTRGRRPATIGPGGGAVPGGRTRLTEHSSGPAEFGRWAS